MDCLTCTFISPKHFHRNLMSLVEKRWEICFHFSPRKCLVPGTCDVVAFLRENLIKALRRLKMGVSILQPYPVKEGLTGAQTIELLVKRVQTLGGQQTGQFLVDCDTYASTLHQMGGQQTPGQQVPHRMLHILHNSEYPASTFALLEVPLGPNAPGNVNVPPGTQTGMKTVSLVADNLFDLLVYKMAPVYTSKKIKIESKGPRFELGDFVVKLGSVLMSQNFKGILVEVEYRPSVVAEACWELLMEFMQGILGLNAQTSVPRTLQPRMKEIYTPLDAVHQYMEAFRLARAK